MGEANPPNDANPLDKLSESIADGDAIDWDAIRAVIGDGEMRPLLEHLRVVAGVAEVHRSQIAETFAEESQAAVGQHLTSAQEAKRWGHLILVRKIGEGAFGEVYEAIDTWLDHPRALKLLKPEIANRASAPQILHEARKLVRVRHPNVVTVHGADSHDGRVGFWMDLIEGQTLEQRVRAGRMSDGEAVYIGLELCRALAAVHNANIVHRDIKAQNVMRASDGGRIILMDFGAGEFRNATPTGRPHGTPLYLAPELLTGGSATVQSDIYALGVLLYYLVTGRFPVEGNSFTDLILAHAQRKRRHLRDARPDLPDGFIGVVERALDWDPAQRFQTAGDFHAALEAREPTKRPGTSAPSDTRGHPPIEHQTPLVNIVVAALVTFAAILISGVVASRTFEVVLNVGPDFTGGFAEYATIGVQCLLPFAVFWVIGIAVVALLTSVPAALGRKGDRLFGGMQRKLEGISPTTIATIVPVAGALIWLFVTWRHWEIFDTLDGVHLGAAGRTLGPALYRLHYSYSNLAAIISFALVFAVWRWWGWLERRADDLAAVRRMKWTTVAVAAVIVLCAIAPRRFVMERFEAVMYKSRLSYVIGTRGDDLLLYVADSGDAIRPVVRRDDPDLKPTHTRRPLVSR